MNSQHQHSGGPSIGLRLLWVFTSLNGRIGRQVYWLAWVAVNCAVISIAFANSVEVGQDPQTGRVMIQPPGLALLIMVLSLPAMICISVKRLHDINASGLFAVALLIFPVSLFATVLIGIIPGKAGPNRFGDQADVPPPPATSE